MTPHPATPAAILRRWPDLGDRQALTIAVLARTGWCNKQIAREMGVDLETVRSHMTRAFRKMGVESRAEAIVVIHGGPW